MPRVGILIPFRFKQSNNPEDAMDPREADIGENIKYAYRFEAVYWDLNVLTGICKKEIKKQKGITFPTCCYFYDARSDSPTYKKVAYKAKLVEAYCLGELKKMPDEQKFIPNWRSQCINGKWTAKNDWVVKAHPEWIEEHHKPSKLWIKLTNFEELNPPLEINDFRKWDGSQLKGVRGAYIKCL